MQIGCFSILQEITYERDYRSEYEQLRKDPAAVFVTGGCLYKGIPCVSKQHTKQIRTHDGDVLYYAKNIFWKTGYSMEPVPEGGFRRYPVDYTIRLSVTEAKNRIFGSRPTVALMIKDVVDLEKWTHHYVIYLRKAIWWSELETETLPWDSSVDVYEIIAKTMFESRWAIETVMPWKERKETGSFEKFKDAIIKQIKKSHPAGAFNLKTEESQLTSWWLFSEKDGSLTDILLLKYMREN